MSTEMSAPPPPPSADPLRALTDAVSTLTHRLANLETAVSQATTPVLPSTAAPPPPDPFALYRINLKPPELHYYDGDPNKLGDWLAHTERLLSMAGHSPTQASSVAFASVYLRGTALATWNNLCSEHGPLAGCNNFTAFSQLLREHMGVVQPAITIRAKLAGLKQFKSVESYYRIYNETLLQLPSVRDDLETREEFIRGLKPDVQNYVRLGKPRSYQEAATMAREYARTVGLSGKFKSMSRHSSDSSSATPMDLDVLISALNTWASNNTRGRSLHRSQPNRRSSTPARSRSSSASSRASSRSASPRRAAPLASLSAAEMKQLRDQNLCFYCRKPGHKIADCRKKKEADKKVTFSKN